MKVWDWQLTRLHAFAEGFKGFKKKVTEMADKEN